MGLFDKKPTTEVAKMAETSSAVMDISFLKSSLEEIAGLPAEQLENTDKLTAKLAIGGGSGLSIMENPYKELNCIILKMHSERALWLKEDGKEDSLECISRDGITPENFKSKKATNCAACSFRKQGCREFKIMDLLTDKTSFPVELRLPWSSFKNMRTYMTVLSASKASYQRVVTQIATEPDKNPDGKPFTKATFKAVAEVPAEYADELKVYAEEILPKFDRNRKHTSEPEPDTSFPGPDGQ